MPTTKEKTPEEEAEERDRKLLAENAARIEAIIKLLMDGDNRETADRKVAESRERVEEDWEDQLSTEFNRGREDIAGTLLGGSTVTSTHGRQAGGANGVFGQGSTGKGRNMVFHPYKGKRVPITSKASRFLELGDALELQLRTMEHGQDLLRALHGAAVTRVKILERLIARNS